MKKLLYNPSQVVTVNTNSKNVKRGKELSEVECLTEHSIILEEDLIKDIILTASVSKNNFSSQIDNLFKVIFRYRAGWNNIFYKIVFKNNGMFCETFYFR